MPKDLTGEKFGRLTVIKYYGMIPYDGKNHRAWICKCECGKECVKWGARLRIGKVRSCGCLLKEKPWAIKHGQGKRGIKTSKAYHAWEGMKSRCYGSKGEDIRLYSSRGITVCDRWINSFTNFLEDMGNPPYEGRHCQLDRIDNNKGYSKENCRWTTARQNTNNRNCTVRVNGEPLSYVSEREGVNHAALYYRFVIKGLNIREAILSAKQMGR